MDATALRFLEPVDLRLAALGALAGAVRGFSGFGSGLVLAPVLLSTLGPTTAVPTMLLLDLGASLYLLRQAARRWRPRVVLPLSIAASVTFPMGALLLIRLDPAVVTRGVSLLVLAMAAVVGTGWRLRRPPSRAALACAGGVGGLLGGLGGIGGPPVVFLVLSAPGTSRAARANLIAHFAMLRATALFTFAALGLLSLTLLPPLVVLAPAFAVGTMAGSRMAGGSNDVAYRIVAALLMAASGVFGVFG